MIRNENFINIQGWMVNELHLKGNELLVFALIYGFSQDENSVFSGSLSYIADWINTTKQSAINILQKLVEKDFIIKIEKTVNNVKLVDYKINLIVVKKFDHPSQKILPGGSKNFLPHNIINNNNNNNNIYIQPTQEEPKTDESKRENLQPYGEFRNVFLTKNEVKNLISNYGLLFEDAIEALSDYIVNKQGKKYKNHYAVMKKNGWVWEKVHKLPNADMKKLQLVSDGNGGYREETIEEYYKRTMNLDLD